jgi:hypothetical protein
MSDWISDLSLMSLNPLTNIRVIMVNVGKGMVPHHMLLPPHEAATRMHTTCYEL